MNGYTQDSIQFLRASLIPLVIIAIIIATLRVFLGGIGAISGTIVGLLILFNSMFRYFLFDEPFSLRGNRSSPQQRLLLFSLLVFGFVALSLAMAAVVLLMSPIFAPTLLLSLAMMIFFADLLVLLAVFGTLLPWSIARDSTYSLKNGMTAAAETGQELLIGVGPVILAVVFVQIILNLIFGEMSAIMALPFAAFMSFIEFIPMVLIAAILTRGYRTALRQSERAEVAT